MNKTKLYSILFATLIIIAGCSKEKETLQQKDAVKLIIRPYIPSGNNQYKLQATILAPFSVDIREASFYVQDGSVDVFVPIQNPKKGAVEASYTTASPIFDVVDMYAVLSNGDTVYALSDSDLNIPSGPPPVSFNNSFLQVVSIPPIIQGQIINNDVNGYYISSYGVDYSETGVYTSTGLFTNTHEEFQNFVVPPSPQNTPFGVSVPVINMPGLTPGLNYTYRLYATVNSRSTNLIVARIESGLGTFTAP